MNNDPNTTLNQQPAVASSAPEVPVAPSIPSVVETTPSAPETSVPEASTPLEQPTQQRVQLVNDTPTLKAIAPGDVPKKDEKNTEILEAEGTGATPEAGVNEEKKSGSSLQTFFLFVLFGGLFAFIFFIDDITNFIETRKYQQGQVVEEITTGTLKCTSERSTNNMDYTYKANFEFRDNKLKRLNYYVDVRGDINLDEAALNELNNECLLIKQYASNLSGIDVTCSLENGLLKETQIFTYDSINRDEAISAFIEAGGMYPEYKKDQDINGIEKEMNAAEYTCERIK